MVFMDVRMPVMDGMAATRAIRAQEHSLGLPRLPILALTATAGEEDVRRCLEAGMDGCLPKPFSGEILAEALSRWMDHKRPVPVADFQRTAT
jgi:CheY-like chemotaxis protein